MKEQTAVTSVVDRLEHQLRREIIFVRGYAAMYREQYLEYLRELRKARWNKDYRKVEAIIDDLWVSTEKARSLQHQGSVAYRRLTALVTAQGFTTPTTSDALPPEHRFTREHADEREVPPREDQFHHDS